MSFIYHYSYMSVYVSKVFLPKNIIKKKKTRPFILLCITSEALDAVFIKIVCLGERRMTFQDY